MDKTLELQSMKIPEGGFWLPKGVGPTVDVVDDPYWLIYWTCVVTFVLIIAPMAWFAWKYRRKQVGQRAESQVDHNQMIEIAWSVLPLVFFVVMFVMGFRGFLYLYVAPANAMELRVTGQKWFWSAAYPEGFAVGGVGAEFVVPTNRPVKVVGTTTDVLHSFFVPNFRVKQDMLPGRYTTLWFEASEPGTYPVLCTEYCGKDHSNMLAKITAVPPEQYAAWAQKMKDEAAGGEINAATGEKLYGQFCVACHSTDGTNRVGPSFKGLYGRQEALADGSTVAVDAAYITESIYEPAKRIAQNGCATTPCPNAMTPFKGTLSQPQVDSIIKYLETLK
jgi:cytochrome c oxidase subunit II